MSSPKKRTRRYTRKIIKNGLRKRALEDQKILSKPVVRRALRGKDIAHDILMAGNNKHMRASIRNRLRAESAERLNLEMKQQLRVLKMFQCPSVARH